MALHSLPHTLLTTPRGSGFGAKCRSSGADGVLFGWCDRVCGETLVLASSFHCVEQLILLQCALAKIEYSEKRASEWGGGGGGVEEGRRKG